MNRIIINGDDFGMNERCSRAIAQALREGLITDTTMMANGAYFDEAVALAREQGFDDRIGVHFNLTEGEPLTERIKDCAVFVSDGFFRKPHGDYPALTDEEAEAAYLELTAQVNRLSAAGIRATHADSHHYIHDAAQIAPIVIRVCREHNIACIRLRRNLWDIPVSDALAIAACNERLRAAGMRTPSAFGKLRELGDHTLPDGAELLVHPDYDRGGALIDRVGMADGDPVGKVIPDLNRREGVVLTGYTRLLSTGQPPLITPMEGIL